MMNPNSSGRPGGAESSASRPEPREPRLEPRDGRTDSRTPAPRAPDARPAEARSPDAKAPEARAAEARPAEVRAGESRAPETRVTEGSGRASVLGQSLRFRGELSAQEDLIIQGSVEGSITHTQCLTVGSDGSMKGDIRARVIVVDGKVEGNLYATESITVRSSAKVKGNLFAPKVGITEGAFFQGQIEMQPSGAAVQEHSARMRQNPGSTPQLDNAAVEKVLSGS